MLNVRFIVVGGLKESYLREAVEEYRKRLTAFCVPAIVELKEARLSDSPSPAEIRAALSDEGKRILAACPARSVKVALCVEGKELSSPELARYLDEASARSGCICFIIGGSFGLSDEVKNAAEMRLSFSRLTFPHQLMRVILLEEVYRGFNILRGTKYHK